MKEKSSSLKSRPASTATLLALAAVGIALTTLLVASIAIKIALLVVAAFLLLTTGIFLALVIARPKPSRNS
jgi:hypothetical protein